MRPALIGAISISLLSGGQVRPLALSLGGVMGLRDVPIVLVCLVICIVANFTIYAAITHKIEQLTGIMLKSKAEQKTNIEQYIKLTAEFEQDILETCNSAMFH